MERFESSFIFGFVLLLSFIGLVRSNGESVLNEAESEIFTKEVDLSATIRGENEVSLVFFPDNFFVQLGGKKFSIQLQVFKDGENVFNGTTKIKSTGLPDYKIPLKTCSNYDVTLDLLNPSNEIVKLSGGLGMATLQRKLQVGPRNQTLSLQLTDEAKPRELNFYATGVDSNCKNVEITVRWGETNQVDPLKVAPFQKLQPLKVGNLYPSTSYNLTIEVKYPDFNIISNSTLMTTKTAPLAFELDIEADVNSISVTITNNNTYLTGLIFNNCYSNMRLQPITETCFQVRGEDLPYRILNLDMSTDYRICLSLVSPDQEKVCGFTKTPEGLPDPPRDLKLNEDPSTLIIEWEEPAKYSGNVVYSVIIEGKCLLADTDHCDEEARKCLIPKPIEQHTNIKNFVYPKNTNWHYNIKVAALNGKGISEIIRGEIRTKPGCSYPTLNYTSRSKEIIVHENPFCQLQGPQDFYISLNNRDKKLIQGESTFTNLNPSQKYIITVSTEIENCKSKGDIVVTLQEKPEGIPTFIVTFTTEDSLILEILRPGKTYELEGETLIYNISIESRPIENDKGCSGQYNSSSYFDIGSNKWKFQYTIKDLKPHQKHWISVQVINKKGPGKWSSAKEAITLPISQNKIPVFNNRTKLRPSANSITIETAPICPFPGDYYWEFLYYKGEKLVKGPCLQHQLNKMTSYTFSKLEAGQEYMVCSEVKAGNPDITCQRGSMSPYFWNQQTCQYSTTECKMIPKPTKSLTQIDWNSDENRYDLFRKSELLLAKDTFDSSSSGALTYKLSYNKSNEFKIWEENELNATYFDVSVENLDPGTSTEVSFTAIGCDNHTQTLTLTVTTRPIKPATAALFCDIFQGEKVMLLIEDSFENIHHGRTKYYTFGKEQISFNNHSVVQLDSRCQEQSCNIESPNGVVCCFWVEDVHDGTNFTHIFEFQGKNFDKKILLEGCPTSPVKMIASLIGFIACLVVAVVLILWMLKIIPLTKKSKSTDKESFVMGTTLTPQPKDQSYALKLEEILEKVKEGEKFTDEYAKLELLDKQLIQCKKLTLEANKWSGKNPDFPKLNRYGNILPYDDMRVILKKPREDCDYINASWVQGFSKKKEFIVTQGPIETTISHFWQMVVENKVKIIVMLTKLKEVEKPGAHPKIKCEKYWPNVGNSKTFDGYKVQSISEESSKQSKNTTLRKFSVSKKKSGAEEQLLKHEVCQIHYTGWPDYGVPEFPQDLVFLYKELLNIQEKNSSSSQSPIVVHCSAGVGRSGTLIALDILSKKIEAGNTTLNLFDTVFQLRKNRCKMVQRAVQYEYLYKCVASIIRANSTQGDYCDDDEYYACSAIYSESI